MGKNQTNEGDALQSKLKVISHQFFSAVEGVNYDPLIARSRLLHVTLGFSIIAKMRNFNFF